MATSDTSWRTDNTKLLTLAVRSKFFDAHDRSGMRENYSQEELVFRGGKKGLDHDRRFAKSPFDPRMQKGGLRLRRWLIAALVFLLTSLVVINSYATGQFRIVRFGTIGNDTTPENYAELTSAALPLVDSGFLVHNQGCRIPAMDPFDPAIKRYIEKEKPLECEVGDHPPLIESNNTSIFVNPHGRDHFYNKSEIDDCCWRTFWRKKDNDNAVIYDEECFDFKESDIPNAEFVKVECSRNGEKIYRDYHAFLPRKPWVEKRCRNAQRAHAKDEHLSVLVVGLDSVSRLNFHRMMPKTVKALQDLGAVEMLGYTKVADNTYPNLVPILSGLSEEELRENCWQDRKKPFDDCPFLWKNFSAAGYRTVFGEDACEMTTFNYLKPGFRIPPTDYYLRPYCIATEHDIGNTWKLNSKLCVGTRKTFDNLLQYTRKVALEFSSDPYFAFFWEASLTHDFFNYPQLGDDSYHDFIRYLSNERLLNNTALIVMSDHGIRWGEFRQTYQGRVEDSLPFVFFVFPDWWRAKFPIAYANLRRNTRSLTTGFDLHETLVDLLKPHRLHEASIRRRASDMPKDNIPRGISWFLPIPDYRTCGLANISSHWCMCHSSSSIPLNDTTLQESASFLVSELNGMLRRLPQCAVLSLKAIKDAKSWVDEADGALALVDYTITIQTEPGDAIFEGSVRYTAENANRKLVGTVSRLNAYGKQSACVDEFNMRLYCYCL
ncbi:hypothetical protein KM043_014991 [Ampulex compressa]|nr:hypothetical protein KM043_014991 [Ampulex compressa]